MKADRRISASRFVAVLTVSGFGILLVMGQWATGSCVQPILADQIRRADVVASGLVTAVRFGENAVIFRASVVYKGVLAAGAVAVRTGPTPPGPPGGFFTSVSSSADYRPDRGTVHTLYLRREADGLVTDSCSGSHPGSATDQEIATLGSGRVIDSAAGPLTQLLDQLAAVPLLLYCLLLLILIIVIFWLRSRGGSRMTPLSGAPA